MCCPTRHGSGSCGCSNNPEGGAVGGGERTPRQVAQELTGIISLVRGFFHSGGNWTDIVDSLRRWECERRGCAVCMTALVNCFSNCSGHNGAVSREDLNYVLTQLRLAYGIPCLCMALERLASQLGEICHKSKEEVEVILKEACESVAADIRDTEGWLIQNEADESSLLDPELSDLNSILSMIRLVCEAVESAEVLATSSASSDAASGSRNA